LVPIANFFINGVLAYWNTLSTGLKWAYDNIIVPIWNGLTWAYTNVLVPISNFLTNVLLAAWNLLAGGIQWAYNTFIKPVFDALSWAYNNILKPVGDFFGSIAKDLGLGGGEGGSSGGSANTAKAAAIAAAQAEIDNINSENATFADALKSGKITQSQYNVAMSGQAALMATAQSHMAAAQAMEKGGIVNSPTLALIGESGPEAVVPLSRSGAAGLGSTQHITNHITLQIGNISNEVDLDKVPEKVSEGIAEFYRRRSY